MFSLIITIISIALVAVLALATLYYGGSAYSKGQLQAQAAKVDNQAQQLTGAAQMFRAANNRWPQNLDELVTSNYIKSIPVAQTAIAQALAGQQWTMPVEYQPVFVLEGVNPELCREVNDKAYGQRGILSAMPVELMRQCSGPNLAQLRVVAAVSPDALVAAAAAGTAGFVTADLTLEAPAAVIAEGTGWMVAPDAGAVEPPSNMAVQLVTPTGGTSFPAVQTGQTASLDFTLKNTGAGDLTNIVLGVEGDDALTVLPGSCGSSAVLEYEDTCTFTVRYAPTAVQALAGTVTVSSSAVNGPTTVAVSGASTGVGSLLFQSPFDFGPRNFGDTTALLTRTLQNNGTAAVSGLAFSFANLDAASVFATESNCPTTLEPGASCEVSASFVPLTGAQVHYGLNAEAGAVTTQGDLSGVGAQLGSSTTSVANANTGNIEFYNLQGPGAITSMVLYSGQTEIARSTSVSHVAGNSSGSATFSNIPSAGNLTLALFDAQGRRRATGSVTVQSALISQNSGSGSYGVSAVNSPKSASFTFQATGTAGLSGVYPVVTGSSAFTVTSSTCGEVGAPVALAANASCTVTVRFLPTAGTPYTGQLTLQSSATNGPLSVSLSGEGASAQTFSYTGNVVNWTVPTTGVYQVEVAGASGTTKNHNGVWGPAGRGARITCSLDLTAGEQLRILVGGRGGYGTYSGGGGGASAVYKSTGNVPQCVGGGGGGSADNNIAAGTRADGRGIVNSDPGQGGTLVGSGSGGGGFYSAGTQLNASNKGGSSIVSDGAVVLPALNDPGNPRGETANSNLGYGGFGGGSPGTEGQGSSGSGGGYSGGTHSGTASPSASNLGGGGSSYSATPNPVVVLGQHTGNGYVSILPQ